MIFSDSKSALALSQNSLVTKKSKHMDLRFHKVRDHFKDLCFVPGTLNKADPLTKPLPGGKYLGIFQQYGSFSFFTNVENDGNDEFDSPVVADTFFLFGKEESAENIDLVDQFFGGGEC